MVHFNIENTRWIKWAEGLIVWLVLSNFFYTAFEKLYYEYLENSGDSFIFFAKLLFTYSNSQKIDHFEGLT